MPRKQAPLGLKLGLRRSCFLRHRAPLPHPCKRAEVRETEADFSLAATVLHRNDWHFYCLVTRGRWWPGTRVVIKASVSHLRIINS